VILPVLGVMAGSHAVEADYRAVHRFHISDSRMRGQLRRFRMFRDHYPDLGAWMKLPLKTRLGADGVSLRARPYLYHLVAVGRLRLDWPWLLTVGHHVLPDRLLPDALLDFLERIAGVAERIGLPRSGIAKAVRVVRYLYLRFGVSGVLELREAHLADYASAVQTFRSCPMARDLVGNQHLVEQRVHEHESALFLVRTVLFHAGVFPEPPRITRRRCDASPSLCPKMDSLIERYVQVRGSTSVTRASAQRQGYSLRRFVNYIARTHPEVQTFAEVTREHALAYAAELADTPSMHTGQPLTAWSRTGLLSDLSVFFQDTTAWGWEGAALRPLLGPRDLPKRPRLMPRFIPCDELNRLMPAVRDLPCPYQRGALLIARWSGARRGEINRLDLNCLDAYPDGTARLRIPVGKSNSERIVPLHNEAAQAIRDLQTLVAPHRGLWDERAGRATPKLFVRQGRLLSDTYLFEASLGTACRSVGLVNELGQATITAHRFRHTVGTELADGGARVHTIMKMLGHTSTEMTLIYAHIADKAVLEDYQKVLGPGAVIAGSIAAQLRSGSLPTESVEWIKSNFFKTELELGHCLRMPQEGPCECDLYLSCAKFVTTSDYIPRLKERLERERELIDDAHNRGWTREAERHECIAQRVQHLLCDLEGEPQLDCSDALSTSEQSTSEACDFPLQRASCER
jgi:integrase